MTDATAPTTADQVNQLAADAEASGKKAVVEAADAKALKTALNDVEKEIATYIAEYRKLAEDTKAGEDRLRVITDRIKQHSGPIATKVDAIISAYDTNTKNKISERDKAVEAATTAGDAMRAAERATAEKQVAFDTVRANRDTLKAQSAQFAKAAKDADSKEDAEAYAEAYAVAKLWLVGVKPVPPVKGRAKALRDALDELKVSKAAMREKTDAWTKAVRKRDDLKATVDELEAKRADLILAKVKEDQASGALSADPGPLRDELEATRGQSEAKREDYILAKAREDQASGALSADPGPLRDELEATRGQSEAKREDYILAKARENQASGGSDANLRPAPA